MGQDPEAIRSEIEQTRERMGDTVDALGYKTDVKARAKESVTDRVDSIKGKFTGVTDSAPSTGDVKDAASRGKGIAQENPLGLAVGAAAVGFLAGLMVPATRVENEKIGPMADTMKDQVKETAQVALEHGKEAAQDAGQAAAQAVKETGQQHAEDAKSDLKSQAETARTEMQNSAPTS
jgi:gas vesicle protein